MTKLFSFLMAVLLICGPVQARITGTTVDPETCWGDGGEEVCVDSSGNIISTTDNDASLGTSALRWSNVLALDATFSDDVTVTDDLDVDGDSFLGDGPADEVGINETTPDASLEVASGDNVYVLRISSQNGSTDLLTVASADGAIVQEGGVILNEGGAAVDLRIEGDNTANLLIVDGSADAVGVGGDATPDATLEVAPRAADTYGLRISSQNGSTDLLAVDVQNQEIEITGELGIGDTTPDAMLDIIATNASSSGTVITAAASQTADLLIARDSSENPLVRIGPAGHVGFRQYTKAQIDTLTPDFVGALVQCSNCTLTYAVCRGIGTAVAQFAREGSGTVGCGTGE